MIDVQVGPLGGMVAYLLIILIIIGILAAPTLGGALVWAIAALVVLGVAFFILRRVFLRLTGRRGGSR